MCAQNSGWKPQAYASYSTGQELWAKELIEKLGLEGKESILDIGCGDGKITNYLKESTSGDVVGIDLSEEMIAYAQIQFPNLQFMQMDAQKLSFVEEFDVVFSNAVLHWVRDHKAVIQGIYKALKPNGKMILQMGGKGNAKKVFTSLENVIEEYAEYFDGFSSPYTFYSDVQYLEILQNTGYKQFQAKLIEKDMVHESVDAFSGWLKTTWFPFIEQLPQQLQEEFVQKWVAQYMLTFPQESDGKVHVEMIRLEVEAIK